MKVKLLNLVRPIPETALQVERLESFREYLYTKDTAEPEPLRPTDDTESILSNICCNWCGTWMPIPQQTIIAINRSHSNTEATEATVAEELEVTIDADAAASADTIITIEVKEAFTAEEDPATCKLEEIDKAEDPTTIITTVVKETGKGEDSEDLGANNIIIEANTPELSNQLDFFEYLTGTPMLCEVVCSIWGGQKGQEIDLRAQRVAALRARWVGRSCYPLPWLSSPHVSTRGQYSTDPNTGECKTQ